MPRERRYIAHRREKDGTNQYLHEHLKGTTSWAAEFAGKIGLKKAGELVGLLHDLGKATDVFYQYIASATGLIDSDADDYVDATEKRGKIDHSSAGAQYIYNQFSNREPEINLFAQILALVLASHHSGLINCLTPSGEDNFTRRMHKSEEQTRFQESLTNLDANIKQRIDELISNDSVVNQLKQKLILLKEDNDSRETYSFKIGLLTRFLFSCLIDADRVDTANFEFPEMANLRNQGKYTPWSILIKKLNRELDKFTNQNKVDTLRQEISRHSLECSSRPKGLYQLTVPTGGGKTLSSLRFALNHADKHHMDRIIYVIPYTSIIDQNAETARRILEDKNEQGLYLNHIVLEHHSNLTPDEENTRQKLLAENWDAPIIFTTMVQFLETLFGFGTRSARRMHQLANAVIIFDEVQTLPVQCVHLFNIAIRFLIKTCGSTIVLCTATQPLLDKIEPEKRALQIGKEQQMMPDVQKLFDELKRVKVYDWCKIGGWMEQEVVDLAGKELNETGSVLIIVNTKKAASALFRRFKNDLTTEVYHLSTNMCPVHRMEVLDKIKACLKEKRPVICVSTQLIEAGVDIDFGSVIRYLAGLDSIAQAAGRCNRNGTRSQPGRVFIINPQEENLDKLKDIKIGRDKAERVLEEYKANPEQFDGDILGLKAMERYYQYYFYARKEDMNYPINSNSAAGRADNLFDLLSTNPKSVQEYQRINSTSPKIPLRQSFMTAAKIFQAIDSLTRGVIVPYGEEGNRIISDLCTTRNLDQQYRLLKEAQRYSVNVYCSQLHEFIKKKIIREVQEGSGIFYLDERHYSDEYGMSEVEANEMKTLTC